MCARNFEGKLGLLIRNAIEADRQKPVKIFPCTYIKSINRSAFLRLKKKSEKKKKIEMLFHIFGHLMALN